MEAADLVVTPDDQSPHDSLAMQQAESRVREYLQLVEGGRERRPKPPKLVFGDGRQLELTPDLLRMLLFVLQQARRGDPVMVMSKARLLTTNQAAQVLNVSRPFLVQLLQRGEIKFTKIGTHHRLRLSDVLQYKQRRDQRMSDALDTLAIEAQEAGNYFDD